MGPIFLAAGAVYLLAAVAYFGARFRLAALLGALYAGLAARVAFGALAPVPAALAVLLLAVAPGAYLAIHWLDARRGLFYLPTIYSIPLAFLGGLALWLLLGLALLL